MIAVTVALALISVALNVLAWWHVSLTVDAIARKVDVPFDAGDAVVPPPGMFITNEAGLIVRHPFVGENGPSLDDPRGSAGDTAVFKEVKQVTQSSADIADVRRAALGLAKPDA